MEIRSTFEISLATHINHDKFISFLEEIKNSITAFEITTKFAVEIVYEVFSLIWDTKKRTQEPRNVNEHTKYKTSFIFTLLSRITFTTWLPPLEEIKGSITDLATAIKGALGYIPELFFDLWDNFFQDHRHLRRAPRIPVPELIKNEGYPSEVHRIVTKDGYILNIHRIPHGKSGIKNGKVVFLQHGMMASSSDFVLLGSKHGLAYMLADQGYDVWLGNTRGNTYSKRHTFLSPDSKEFWNFSWHEIGTIEVPAIIDYILLKTGQEKLFHIGHSQGATSFYVMASEKPEYNSKVIAHVSLAPIGFMNNMFSPFVKFLAQNAVVPVSILLELIGQYEFFSNSGLINFLGDAICSSFGVGKVFCKNIIFAIVGISPDQISATSIPLIVAHYPAGTSTKQLLHYGQEIYSGQFQEYDYFLKNHERYGYSSPPDYNPQKISTPVHLIYGSNDWMAAPADVKRLASQIGNLKELYNVPIPTWNHLDFNFGKDAPSVVFDKVVDILSKY